MKILRRLSEDQISQEPAAAMVECAVEGGAPVTTPRSKTAPPLVSFLSFLTSPKGGSPP